MVHEDEEDDEDVFTYVKGEEHLPHVRLGLQRFRERTREKEVYKAFFN